MTFATSPLGIDSDWWTALATIVALALGLFGIIGPIVAKWLKEPRLSIVFQNLSKHSEIFNEQFQLRLPISNLSGRQAAKNVEVFLHSITEKHVQHPLRLPTYLPIRLLWSHSTDPVCDRIAGGAYRLLDLGDLTFTITSDSGFVDAVMARLASTTPIALGFRTEVVPLTHRIGLPVGTYDIGFLITCETSSVLHHLEITVRNYGLDHNKPASHYLELRKG